MFYLTAAVERAMKRQEVILRAEFHGRSEPLGGSIDNRRQIVTRQVGSKP